MRCSMESRCKTSPGGTILQAVARRVWSRHSDTATLAIIRLASQAFLAAMAAIWSPSSAQRSEAPPSTTSTLSLPGSPSTCKTRLVWAVEERWSIPKGGRPLSGPCTLLLPACRRVAAVVSRLTQPGEQGRHASAV